MIYAFGERARYEPKLATGEPLYKSGKGADKSGRPYPGGSVFRTEAEARRFVVEHGLAATRNVYGVLADWDKDTEQLPGEPFRRLLRRSQIVRLETKAGAGPSP